jgi:formylglycine-generating enzyme required for sulfatase activity
MTKNQTTANILTVLFAAALSLAALASCTMPQLGGTNASGTAGTVTVRLAAGAQSRAATAPTSALASKFDVILTDAKGTVHTAAGATVGSNAALSDIAPGAFTVSVTTYDKSGTQNGTGTGSGTIAEGASAAVTVPVTVSQSGAGTGSIKLAITFPTNVNIGDVSAEFVDATASGKTVTRTYNSILTDGKATLSASDIPLGIHYLAITFLEDDTKVIGRIVEAVNVWNGIETNLWLKADGTTMGEREFTAAEIATSTSQLAYLSVAGKEVDLVAALTPGGASITGTSSTDWITDDAITFTLIGNTKGQGINYTWNLNAYETITSGTASSPLTTDGASGNNTLVIDVTSPGEKQTTTYKVTFTRAYKVRFETAYGSTPGTQILQYNNTVTAPANPSATGFEFGGWYTDSSYTTQWVFGAKWTTLGSITAYITEPQYLGIYFKRFGKIINAMTLDKDAKLTLSVPTGGTSYEWYIDTTVAPGQTTASFSFNPISESITAGIHTLSVIAVYNGVTYSGNLAVTVTNDYMVTIIPSSMQATYEQKTWEYSNDASTTSVFTHSLTRPFSMAKYEVSYGLWSSVYQWAIQHGYTIANAGQDGYTAGTDPTMPVTCVSYYDAIVWCNAYSEMMGYTPCYYSSTSDRTAAAILRSTTTAANIAATSPYYSQNYVLWTANGYRLPTEGEWHYAASCGGYYAHNYISGGTSAYASGNPPTSYSTWANAKTGATVPVTSKDPNIWGLFNMSGNVWEYCFDRFDNVPASAQINYTYPASPSWTDTVVCGGSFKSAHPVGKATVGNRSRTDPSGGDIDNGFRLARTIP